MKSYQTTEAYQKLIEAVRANNLALTTAIIEEQLSSVSGREKAFWLFIRVDKWGMTPGTPNYDQAWADLQAALEAAPDDPDTREWAVTKALHLAISSERPSRLVPFARALRADISRFKKDWSYCINLNYFHMLTGDWQRAHRAIDRALENFFALPSEETAPYRGQLPRMYSLRALGAAACAMPEEAARDLETAEQLFKKAIERAQDPITLALAKAELAIFHGDLHGARSHLQAGVARTGWKTEHVSASPRMIVVDLTAARIARAEGNLTSFRHFCQKALARAEHHDLPMSAARVRRVMEGAER